MGEQRAKNALAREETADNTSDVIIRSLTDVLVMPVNMIQPQERAFAADLLQQVAASAGDAGKAVLSERLAGLSEAPAALVRWMLMHLDDETLEPMLRRGACISDNDLVSLSRAATPARLRIIAGRVNLSPTVASVLVETGYTEVAVELLQNPTTRLDEPTLMALTARAAEETALGEPLVTRPEMTPSCGLKLFWVLDARLRVQVLRRFLTDCQVLPQVLVMSRPSGDLIAGALRCGSNEAPKEREEAAGAVTGRAAAAELMAVIENNDSDAIAASLEAMELASTDAARMIADDAGGEALAVACKVAGASRFSFQSASAAWCEAQAPRKECQADAETLQIVFDTLSFKQARMALTYWNWQAAQAGPYCGLASGDVPDSLNAA